MQWIETTVVFDHENPVLAEELIADVFFDLGLHGVAVEELGLQSPDPRPVADAAPAARHAVTGYFPQDAHAAERLQRLEQRLAMLKTTQGVRFKISCRPLDDQDWAQSWKAYFWPLKIGANIVVKPTWRDYTPAPADIVIELDPGMAFGTGTHPSTALCIELLETYLKKGDAFLDVGTGSGILMVAAAKLGAGRLRGRDTEAAAVKIAAENLQRNRIKADDFRVVQGSLVDGVRERFDLVAANILAPVILNLLDDVGRILNAGGRLICAGLIRADQDPVMARMQQAGFEILECRTRQEWAAIAGRLF